MFYVANVEKEKEPKSPEEQALEDARLVKLLVGAFYAVRPVGRGKFYIENALGLYKLAQEFNRRNGLDIEKYKAISLSESFREQLRKLPQAIISTFKFTDSINPYPLIVDEKVDQLANALKSLATHAESPVEDLPKTHLIKAITPFLR